MGKYKVSFQGFAYIVAEGEEEARELLENEEYAYLEFDTQAEEVDEFLVTI